MLDPVDRGLNVAVIHLANRTNPRGYSVAADAPDTFAKLKAHMDQHNRLTVWNGASDQTIFGDPEVNYAFRAWHDMCHFIGNHDFTPEGEAAACEMQVRQLLDHYGTGAQAQRWAALLRAEVTGQAQYFAQHGHFPDDQVAFDVAYAASPDAALAQAF